MTDPHPAPKRFMPLLLLLFVGSGCAALIYEVVWFQLLQLVIGSSSISLGVLLGTFMGGMCLGSLLLPRLISTRPHPLRMYAALEFGIGLMGLAVLFGLPIVSRIYSEQVGPTFDGIFFRGVVSAVCLLLPTMLMGATLPAIARWIETTPRGVSWLGFFYGGNTVGAVGGCLLAGFYLLRVHNLAAATYVAVGVNLLVAGTAFILSSRAHHEPPTEAKANAPVATAAGGVWSVYIVIALSGLSALGAEAVWTRLLSLLLGATVYTFSIILAVFLAGLGLGSSVGAWFARLTSRPKLALGICQLLLMLAIAWTAGMIARSIPYWPVNPSLSQSPWINFQFDIARCLWAFFPAACLWGASFPLALAAVAAPGQDAGRLVSRVYAANTVGAIAGAILFSIFLVPAFGSQNAERILIGVAAFAAMVMLVLSSPPAGRLRSAGVAFALVAALTAGPLCLKVAQIPWELVAYGRFMPTRLNDGTQLIYMGEGMNSSVAVTEMSNGTRSFHVSGKVEASNDPADMRLQRMLGHIPALVHPHPESVLIVGCGAGVTAGCFVVDPTIKRIVICEIEPLIPTVVAKYFAEENHHLLEDPRVHIVFDDARHYILTTRENFDIITSDPIHPWVKGAATLYTKEYFELVKRRLNPGGVVTQWVPLYESNMGVVQSEVATFFDAFPQGTVWSNDIKGAGYDVVLLGQNGPTKIDIDQIQERLQRPEYADELKSLNDVFFTSAVELFGTYGGQASDLVPWSAGGEINHDRNLRLQYLAGMGLDEDQGVAIYNAMKSYRHYPENVFTTSPGSREELWRTVFGGKP